MTRRGSLAYYFAAVVVGCLFTSGVVWVASRYSPHPWDGPYLAFYAASLATGSVTAATGAFLLRRICRGFNLRDAWHWILLGAAVAPLTVWVFSRFVFPWWSPTWLWLAGLFLGGGAGVVVRYGLWLAIPAGALTAYILYLVDSAFSD